MSFEELDHKTARKRDGYTALHVAAANNHGLRNIKHLFEKSSRFSEKEERMKYLEMKAKDGSTALDIAQKKEKTEIVEVSLNGFSLLKK